MKILFHGATEGVTGSNFLVETNGVKFLVDCGMFQGGAENDRQNWQKFPYNPSEINFAIATHSHIDHIGRLPYLHRQDFKGKIYSTHPTAAFARIFLEDTCKIVKNTAESLGLEKLYEQEDVLSTLQLFAPYEYYQSFIPAEGIEVKFYDAGHILGSAIIEIKAEGKTIIFSGDLGNPPVPILKDTDFITNADYVVMESTYGDRNHEPFEQRKLHLERTIEDTCKQNGVLLVPSFAMERTQELLYELNDLIENNHIKQIPVFVDSPLAIKATEVYEQFPQYFDSEAKEVLKKSGNFFNFPGLTFTKEMRQSNEIAKIPGSKIIIAGSGMSTGGRILFHEQKYLPLSSTTLLVVGFQVNGTLGRTLKDGVKRTNIGGKETNINAKIEVIDSYSAHADQSRLAYWLSQIKTAKKVFLVHGEPETKQALLHKIEDEVGIETIIPKTDESFEV